MTYHVETEPSPFSLHQNFKLLKSNSVESEKYNEAFKGQLNTLCIMNLMMTTVWNEDSLNEKNSSKLRICTVGPQLKALSTEVRKIWP